MTKVAAMAGTGKPNANRTKEEGREHGTHWKTGVHGILSPTLVYEYARQGMNFDEISKLYGCHKTNIAHAVNVDDELREAWERGHMELLIEYTGQLKKRAFENDTMLMFALKTQFGYCEEQFKIGKQLDQQQAPRVTIFIPDNNRDNQQGLDEDEA